MEKTNVLELLEQQAALSGDKPAFGDPSGVFTFGEVLHRARCIGSRMADLAGNGGAAFYMEKSKEAVCAMFGAVYAGRFYSFIDVRQPVARAEKMLETLAPALIVADEAHMETAAALAASAGCPLFAIEELMALDKEEPEVLSRIRKDHTDTSPLYVNFTSGSTGTPKGVAVSHRSVLDFIERFAAAFSIEETDVIANQAPFDFDVSVKDVYSGLYTGACVRLIPRDYFSQPAKLMDYLADTGASVLIWAVSALLFVSIMNGLEYRRPERIRMILFSGEVMPPLHLKKFREAYPEALFVNLYGPTEITCNCTYYVLPAERRFEKGDVIPAGIPFPNEKVFLVDEEGQLVTGAEPGRKGEILVGGTCLALGYWNDPAKTAEAFVQNPLQSAYPERVYRTGDLGFYDEEGQLVYAGRKDFQVKHMGHRIELGEIEQASLGTEGVLQAVCLYDEGKHRIVLCLRANEEQAQELKERVLAALAGSLPPFMHPGKILVLHDFPLNKNGKTDRKALAEAAGIRPAKKLGEGGAR